MILTPNLLTSAAGNAVTAADWARRRAELAAAIIPHEYGGMPPVGVRTEAMARSGGGAYGWPGVTYRTYEVRVRFESGGELWFTLSLWRPPGDGPFPVVLNGDGCWRYFNDGVIRQVLQRGCIAASFDRTEAAADNPDRYRESGLYRVFPDAGFGALAAWAWAYHRAVDALLSLDDVRPDGIAITGHSRGGKCVLLAGATDERIAITNPNDSGIGGSGLHRLKVAGSEVVDSFFGSRNIFWFSEAMREYRGRDAELPYDQHFLHAQVAPRGLLVTEAYEDVWANPPGSYAACLAARDVYEMLGARDKIGWAVREGGHAHTPTDFEALLDFMDVQLQGKPVRREFQRELFPSLATVLTPANG